MRCLHRRQGFGQSCGHIVFHAAGDAGIARHLSAQAHELVGCFVMAETLRGLNELQEVGRLKLSDRLSANDRENRILQIAAQFLGVLFGERRLVLGEPFPRHKLKGIPLFPFFGEFFFSGLLFLFAGINPPGKQFLGFIAPMAGVFQGNRRICAKAQQLLLALKSVGKPPQFAAGGRHMQVQSAAVRKFLHLAVGPGVPHSGIRKFHVGILQNSPEVCSENQKNLPPSS